MYMGSGDHRTQTSSSQHTRPVTTLSPTYRASDLLYVIPDLLCGAIPGSSHPVRIRKKGSVDGLEPPALAEPGN